MHCDVTIVGAGPYGLAAAAYLGAIKGLDIRVFGDPMLFWQRNMPTGMILRSAWTATAIASPNDALSLENYQSCTGNRFYKSSGRKPAPMRIEDFVSYGLWYRKQAVPELDCRSVHTLRTDPKGFKVTLSDGESFTSRRIVVAAGIGQFAWCPPEFVNMPVDLASHTSAHRSFNSFARKEVLVLGSGQSALESAALLHEAGASVEILARAPRIVWLAGWASTTLHWRLGARVKNLLYAPTDVGPAGLSQLCARPDALKLLPRWLQDRVRKRAVRPAGARWLVARLQTVPIRLGCRIAAVSESNGKATVRLDDGTERCVDHVMLGTGYRVEISRYPFLPRELLSSISSSRGYPRLSYGLETSVPGLHILGSPAAWSFGPLMQFISGTGYVGKTLSAHIAEARKK